MSDTNETLEAAEAGKSCCTPAPEATCVTVDGKCIPLDAIKKDEEEPEASLARQVFAEALGTMFLVAVIVGSGYHGDILSPDDGVALLGNTLATWGILFVLITVFGPVSGAHFNPVVSTAFCLKREIEPGTCLVFFAAQFSGCILGTIVAHGMFEDAAAAFDGKDRDTNGELFSEAVATFGLLLTIFGSIGAQAKATIPMAVGLYITAGCESARPAVARAPKRPRDRSVLARADWFTSSTSFANPAVTVARSFTNTFASINPGTSVWRYFIGQAVGLAVGLPFVEWLYERKPVSAAFATLFRK